MNYGSRLTAPAESWVKVAGRRMERVCVRRTGRSTLESVGPVNLLRLALRAQPRSGDGEVGFKSLVGPSGTKPACGLQARAPERLLQLTGS